MIVFVLIIAGAIYIMNKASVAEMASYEGEWRLRHVHPSFSVLIDEWKKSPMSFPIIIVSGLRYGAKAEAQQARFYATGMSRARTLGETAHGRGAAIDVWPVEFRGWENRSWLDVPEAIKLKFFQFGLFAENSGFTAGMRWRGQAFPYGDQPHIELKDWRKMPYPPTGELFDVTEET